jgi:hypothetical protein
LVAIGEALGATASPWRSTTVGARTTRPPRRSATRGGTSSAFAAELTDPHAVAALVDAIKRELGSRRSWRLNETLVFVVDLEKLG